MTDVEKFAMLPQQIFFKIWSKNSLKENWLAMKAGEAIIEMREAENGGESSESDVEGGEEVGYAIPYSIDSQHKVIKVRENDIRTTDADKQNKFPIKIWFWKRYRWVLWRWHSLRTGVQQAMKKEMDGFKVAFQRKKICMGK